MAKIYVVPFVQGSQSQCLCLDCSFGSWRLWTTEVGSFLRILPDALEPPPGKGWPGRDRCCDGHGGACLWERTGEGRGSTKDLRVHGLLDHSNAKPHTHGTFVIRVPTGALFWNTTTQLTPEQLESHLSLLLCFIRISKRSHAVIKYSLRNPADWSENCAEVIWTFPKDQMDLFLNSISLSYIHNYANCWVTTCQGLVHRCTKHMLGTKLPSDTAENSLHGGLVTASAELWLVRRIMRHNK